ncbi:hypothetical protein C8J56DRAFT_770700 [Mycena floridula]|nr:hypothetical protein C8J56DRAFT_770700 [Mycena floridula]
MDTPDATTAVALRKCSGCKVVKELTATHFKSSGPDIFQKTCITCGLRGKRVQDCKKVAANVENQNPNDLQEAQREGAHLTEHDPADFLNLTDLSLHDFLRILGQANRVITLTARINLSTIGKSGCNHADTLAKHIWEAMNVCFVYQSQYKHKRTPSTYFSYNCTQNSVRQHQPKKTKTNGTGAHDKGCMPAFQCSGWLHITLFDETDIAFVKISHDDDHVAYCNIAVLPEIQEYVKSNPELNPRKLWAHILKMWYPTSPPPFLQKSIYHLWAVQDQKRWKHNENELKSAKILLKEAAKLKDIPRKGLYAVEPINLPTQDGDGFTAIAFALPEMLCKFGGQVRELALDSAWGTNHSSFEVFALLSEVYGSGLPFGYLLIQSNQGIAGGKQWYLDEMLGYFNMKWTIHALATLTDKDWAEINAFLARYPKAKHQLCFWHSHGEYHFVDPTFLPISQSVNPSMVCSIIVLYLQMIL